MAESILIGQGESPCGLLLSRANRHGLIAGATGTGKTVTLQVLAEAFSRAGVPVFCADIKGDLAGISQPGTANPKIEARAAEMGIADFAYEASPVVFWDVFGEQGHRLRATVAEMGPMLLSRMLELNDTQEGVLNIAFKLADDEGLLLLDFKDLRAILAHVGDRASELQSRYGQVSKQSVGTIQRRLLVLEQQGGEQFFGEPALALQDLMLVTPAGRGAVNVLAADKLAQSPRLYATFLLWLLAELFEELPEVGDLPKPKLVFFFDEAHLLFKEAPRALVDKVEQVVRLIRSKGVGVYFVTQNPLDLPAAVLGQLGNRVQHALRAYTPLEQQAVKAAAQTFRPNPRVRVEEAITTLAVGEALVSTLQEDGAPSPVEQARIAPPRGRIGAITREERQALLAKSPIAGHYDIDIDRESAFERLNGRVLSPAATGPQRSGSTPVRSDDPWGGILMPTRNFPAPPPAPRSTRAAAPAPDSSLGGILGSILMGDGKRQSPAEAMAKSAAREIGRALTRGILGSLKR